MSEITRRLVLAAALGGLLASIIWAVSSYLLARTYAPDGHSHLGTRDFVEFGASVSMAAVALLGVAFLAPKGLRRTGSTYLALAGAYFILSSWLPFTLGARDGAIQTAVDNAGPLIEAIEVFVDAHGYPPSDVGDLVPSVLSTLPKTGIGAWPHYGYQRYTDLQAWELSFDSPLSMLDFTRHVYRPGEAYSESWQRVESTDGKRWWAEHYD